MCSDINHIIVVRDLGQVDYASTWQAMSDFTDARTDDTVDELWLLEHNPVYTQGQTGKAEHLLASTTIPIVQTDRGGQITYHGPGQLIAYPLLSLKRRGLGVRDMVTLVEESVILLCDHYGIKAYAKKDAPGVYIDDAKVASLGLKVRRGCCFHGVGINIAMDLSPFLSINPCGYQGLEMTQLQQFEPSITLAGAREQWLTIFTEQLGITRPLLPTQSATEGTHHE